MQYFRNLAFMKACVLNEGSIVVLCFDPYYGQYEVPNYILIITIHDGKLQWSRLEKKFQSIAICKHPASDGSFFLISRRGEVEIINISGDILERVDIIESESGQLAYKQKGFLQSISSSYKNVIACGMSGQVYRLDEKNWRKIGPGQIPDQDENWFLDAIGINEEVTAVGLSGCIKIYCENGYENHSMTSDKSLVCVYIKDQDLIFILGSNGTILQRKAKTGFTPLAVTIEGAFFRTMTIHDGVTYFGTDKGLFMFDGNEKMQPVAEMSGQIDEIMYLESSGDRMWCVARSYVAAFFQVHWSIYRSTVFS